MKQKPTPFITHDVVDNKRGGYGHGVQLNKEKGVYTRLALTTSKLAISYPSHGLVTVDAQGCDYYIPFLWLIPKSLLPEPSFGSRFRVCI